jgi:hypothetical protein
MKKNLKMRPRSLWAFQDCYTIDPSKSMRAWEGLSLNQQGAELGMLPKILHLSLLETLKERQSLDGRRRSKPLHRGSIGA